MAGKTETYTNIPTGDNNDRDALGEGNRQQETATESNPELELAREIVENTGVHLFLTGKAGTGKTTFLKRLRTRSPKRMVVLAPTGIAAINAGGMTLHSFFQLPFAPYVPDTVFRAKKEKSRYRFGKEKIKIIRSMDLLVIDEISMVRADMLDAVDAVLRRYRQPSMPFGGVQLLLIGDLQQLAPVVKQEEWEMLSAYYDTPFFFSSRALAETQYATVELKRTYRQTDRHFLDMLNSIRENRADQRVLDELNLRFRPGFTPPPSPHYIRLTTHNVQAQAVNDRELGRIAQPVFTYRAEIRGKFPEYSYPTDETLHLKLGAQVMFIKNDRSPDKRYFNGMIGTVTDINAEGFSVSSPDYPEEIRVQPEQWDNSRYTLDERTKEITEEIEGSFIQFPIRLAWAITIHKSQGLTFDRAIIDAADAFTHGQVYVALSRCRTLEGMVLSSPLNGRALISDLAVSRYTDNMAQRTPDRQVVTDWEKCYCHTLVQELFTFSDVAEALETVVRLVAAHFQRNFPHTMEMLNGSNRALTERIVEVASRFAKQYSLLISEQDGSNMSAHLQERIHHAAEYFARELTPLVEMAADLSLTTDNKLLKTRMDEAQERLMQTARQKVLLLEHIAAHGFLPTDYLRRKAVILLGEENEDKTKRNDRETPRGKKKKEKLALSPDITDPLLYRRITAWRTEKMKELGLPAYCILQQKAVLGIVNHRPTSRHDMLRIPFLGKTTVEKYGEELLQIVREHTGATDEDADGQQQLFSHDDTI